MRSTACGLITLALLSGCGGKYSPKSAVLTGWDRTRAFGEDLPSTVQYSGHALVATPVVPILPFGSAFDLTVLVGAKKTGVSSYQFARFAAPDGVRWLAIETDEATGDQTVISNIEDIDAWSPEIPVKRKVDPAFKVVDRSTNDELDITITYSNPAGEEVEAQLLGDPPQRFQKKRSTNPQGVLRGQALLVVDVPHRESLFKAKIKIDGRQVTVAKVAGFIPLQMSAEIASGGLATGAFTTVPGEVRPLESSWKKPRVVAPASEEPAPAPAPAPEPVVDPLQTAMQAGKADLQGCYKAAAEANAEVEGRILLAWKVTEGAASDVAVVLDTAGDEGLAACVVEKVGSWTYAEGIAGDVGFPVTIVKGRGVVLGEAEVAPEEGATDGKVTAPRDGAKEEAPEAGTDGAAPDDGAAPEDGAAPKEGDGKKMTAERKPADELPDGDELPEGDAGDLLGDDPDVVTAKRKPAVVYNGVADFMSNHRMPSGNVVELDWQVDHTGDRVYVRQVNPERTLQYEYLVNYDSIELTDVAVYQTGRSVPVIHVDINPAIPDLRRPFSGKAESRYVIDVNGQDGYATGRVEAWWSEGGPKVKFIPDAPDWTTDGNLLTTIVFRQGGSDIVVQKTGE